SLAVYLKPNEYQPARIIEDSASGLDTELLSLSLSLKYGRRVIVDDQGNLSWNIRPYHKGSYGFD
ncbi:MAG: hypothetical protein ACPGEF_07875, partial [Endozoicomonas sp.]